MFYLYQLLENWYWPGGNKWYDDHRIRYTALFWRRLSVCSWHCKKSNCDNSTIIIFKYFRYKVSGTVNLSPVSQLSGLTVHSCRYLSPSSLPPCQPVSLKTLTSFYSLFTSNPRNPRLQCSKPQYSVRCLYTQIFL